MVTDKGVIIIENSQYSEELDVFLIRLQHEIGLLGCHASRVNNRDNADIDVDSEACIFDLDCLSDTAYLAEVSKNNFSLLKRLILECSSSP